MSTPAIDYNALAQQAGAVGSAPPPPPAAPQTDYNALAQQAGAVSSTPGPPTQPAAPQGPSMQASDRTWIQRGLTWLHDPQSPAVNEYFPSSAREAVAGGIKDTLGFAGNILAMINHSTYTGGSDQDKEHIKNTPGYRAMRDVADTLRSGGTPTGLYERIGALGAQALQMWGPSEIMKLAGPAVEGVEAGAHLDQAKQLAQALTKNKVAAGFITIGIKAAKEALMQAGFQYGHTMDPKDAAIAGVLGAGTGAVFGAAEPAVAAAINKYGTKTVPIEGVGNVRVSPQQLAEDGTLTTAGAATSKIAQEQQEAFRQLESSSARKGVANVLSDVNQSRPVTTPITDPARLLPSGEPFKFRLQTDEPEETITGDLTQPPRKKQIGTQVVERKTGAQGTDIRQLDPATGEGPALDAAKPVATDSGKLIRQPKFQYLTSTKPGSVPREAIVGGGGMLETEDVNEATKWLGRIEENIKDPMFNDLNPRRQATLLEQQKDLSDQIRLFHAGDPTRRLQPIDIQGAMSGVDSAGTAATVYRTHAQPITDILDGVSDGAFSEAHSAERKAQASLLSSDHTPEARQRLEDQIAQAQATMNGIFRRNSDRVTPQDFADWHKLQRAAYLMDGLDTITKNMANGVTPEITAEAGLQRYVKGDHLAFERWLSDPKYGAATRRDLTNMIGQEGINNYRQMFTMLDSAPKARNLNGVLKNVFSFAGFHPEVLGLSSFPVHVMTGMTYPHAMLATGSVAGGAWIMRKMFQLAADHPKFGDMVRLAASGNVAPKIYAPALTRTLMEIIQKDSPTHDEDEKETPAKP